MSRKPQELDLDARVRVDKILPAGRPITIAADAEQREMLAIRFKVEAINSFSADLLATRFKGGIRAAGRVRGEIVQPCVVTGEPVAQTINEPIDRIFLPGHDAASEARAGAEIFVNLEDDDLPDYFEGEEIDLGDLATEIFALAIDLYPRAPGAELTPEAAGDDPALLSPFAALKALKKD